ncbi:MAG: hypothetical protein ACK44D_08185 [Bacteroidia bacterium]
MNNLTTFYKTLKSFLICLFFIVLGYQTKANGFDDTAKYELKLRERSIIKKVTENGKTQNKKQSEFVLRLFKNGKHLIEFDAILDSFYRMSGETPEMYELEIRKVDKLLNMNIRPTEIDASILENYMSTYLFGKVGWKKERDVVLIQYSTSNRIDEKYLVDKKGDGQFFLNLKEKINYGLYFQEVIYDSLLDDIGNKFLLRAKEYHYRMDSSNYIDNYELLLNDCCSENFKEWKVRLGYSGDYYQNVVVLVDVVCTLCTAPKGEKKIYSIYKAYIDFDDPWFYEYVNKDFHPFFFPEEPILKEYTNIDYQFFKYRD